MAITVTATATNAFTNGINCQVMVLTGAAATQNGATAKSATAYQASVTPHATGSRIYGALLDDSAFTANGSTTIYGSTVSGGISYASCKSTGTTTASTPVTVGASAPSHVDGGCALLEVLGTTTEDASAPADAIATGAKTVTTASFTPPAGSLLVALVEALVDLSTGSVALSDTSSLAWTEQVNCGGTDGYAGVWTAQVPGGSTTQGTASLTAAGSLAAAAVETFQETAALTAAGSLTAGGTETIQGAAALTATSALSATETPPVQGAAALTAAGSLSAAASQTFHGAASLAGAAVLSASGGGLPSIVQQVSGTSTSDYGLSSVPISTTAGNGIVLYAGWDLHNSPTDGPVPVLYPADSAGNLWVHLGTSGAGGYGSRCTIWACPNARAVEWVSASLTAYANSLAYMIIEVENFPSLADLDVEADAFLNAGVPTIELITATGPGHWTAQDGVTSVSAQAIGGGGGGGGATAGGGVSSDAKGAGGGGGGEYAGEPVLAVTPGSSYGYAIGSGGAGGTIGIGVKPGNGAAGSATTFAGDSVTVTAHAGHGGAAAGSGGAGGTGSSNTTHFNGGAGGARAGAQHGMGGGGSGGGTAAGQSVGTDVRTEGLPGPGGGAGGPGGLSSSPYYGYRPDTPPGGGGGGGGSDKDSSGSGAAGASGQIVLTYSVTGPETLALAATTAAADLGFTMMALGASGGSLSAAPGTPWTPLGTVSAGGAIDGVTIFPFWAPAVASTTVLNPSWTVTASASISGVLAAVEASPSLPVLSNPSFPNVYVQIAEGFQPGDPTAPPPSWTDISDRCMGKDGDSFITVNYGQEYELATPEAGEMVIGVNNLDGAFTPGAPSPYTIALGMPVRVLAFWDGSYYQIGYGYTERTPVEFPDLPQWGLSRLTCTDSIAVLNSATMPSALQGDILADAPYAYLLCNEQYLSYVNGLTPVSGNLASYTYSEAAGLIAANAARLNQRPGMYCDSTGPVLGPGGSSPALVETGDALNLFGDQGTGMGTGSISGSVSYSVAAAGPGVIYSDPAMPDPLNADGVSLEIWFVYSVAETSGQGITLFQAFGSPSSYWPTATFTPVGTGPASFTVRILSTSNEIQLGLNGTQVGAGVFVPSAAPQQLVFVFPQAGQDTLQVYLNGALLSVATLSAGETAAWQAFGLGPVNYAYSAAPLIQDYVLGHAALFPYALSAGRVASHYATGAGGASGSTVSQGAAQILSWGYLGLPRGGPAGFGPAGSQVSDGIAMGPFYSLEGSGAADGLNAVILSDGGMMYAAPSGVLTILPRWALFNIAPSLTLGDAADGSQVPYETGQAYDFDNTYLNNVIAVTRNDGPTTSITATVKNLPSQLAYFTRSALQETISTNSDLDAYTLSNWQIGQYDQPQLRVRQLSIDAAGKPGLAFPDILIATVSTVATVDRDPVGGSPISGQYIVQKVSHAIGPTKWVTAYQLSPYVAQATVLTLDTAGFNVLGSNTLA